MEIKIDLTHLLNEDDTSPDVSFKIEDLDPSLDYKFVVDDSGFSMIITKDKT